MQRAKMSLDHASSLTEQQIFALGWGLSADVSKNLHVMAWQAQLLGNYELSHQARFCVTLTHCFAQNIWLRC